MASDAGVDADALELFDVAARAKGTPDPQRIELERKLFGKSFEEPLLEGHKPKYAIKEGGNLISGLDAFKRRK